MLNALGVGDGAFEAFTAKANQEFISWIGAKTLDIKACPSMTSTYSSYHTSVV